ncbi:hypothetical protein NDU88_005428 [Pleurodeles waltl]|uniref:Uncharacterized protein n=1 Tax=Pleurodeles waltl TaxID=8319 RepID=A0AAV7MY10_PLEWA|nr:hypothetical protein NDU88_005428 [Pleurodeles waltl]
MSEDKVRRALVLLEQAGRLDLVRTEALTPERPARQASAGWRQRFWHIRHRTPRLPVYRLKRGPPRRKNVRGRIYAIDSSLRGGHDAQSRAGSVHPMNVWDAMNRRSF